MNDEAKVKGIFAKHIIRLRKDKHVTQGELAELLGVGVSTVSDWENAKKLPRAGAIEKLSRAFNISKSSLFEVEEENKNPDPLANEKEFDGDLVDKIKQLAEKHNMDLTDPATLELMDDALDFIKKMRSK